MDQNRRELFEFFHTAHMVVDALLCVVDDQLEETPIGAQLELQSFRECLAQAHEEIRNGEDAHRPHGLQPRS